MDQLHSHNYLVRIEKLNRIGIALSAEPDTNRLMEIILLGAKELTNADAGTMYSVTEDNHLRFEIIRTDSLHIAMGGTTGIPITFPRLPLYQADGTPNLKMVAAFAAVKDQTVNIADAYEAEGFDFSGTRAFDQKTGYRSKSFLTVPLKNHNNEIIGVLQLINARDEETKHIVPFTQDDQALAESLASQAAVALTNQRLIQELKQLFEAFIQTIATAIDEKSPYTGGHCHRVPILAEMLAKEAVQSEHGDLKNFTLSNEELYELKIAAWLHDCGKVVTPTEVVDKATKLETIFDRIHLVENRFQLLKKMAEIHFLKQQLQLAKDGKLQESVLESLQAELQQTLATYDDDLAFIKECNIGGEFMSKERMERVHKIAQYALEDGQPFLTENEIYNLCIPKGTITPEEREVINNHVVATAKMLTALPFPKKMSRVPEIAASHHERPDGGGYPNKLHRNDMTVQARILAIADVFEALTASDRPYKKGKTLSEALKILGFMKKDGHIDGDLFQVFIDSEVFLKYAKKFMDANQIDEIDKMKIPGYQPL
ncbi:MAG: GAF domain-containing protein [Magnetococcales bacterium]|nr:GAF domain-containing protein [Magnetococcales bacterium]NGZ26267.1 GAF domain-containing protein [Magnetococcales bacterium]